MKDRIKISKSIKTNNGFTLTEVIVAMVILAITFAGVFASFMALQKTNTTANRVEQSNDLLTGIIDSFYDVSYNSINNSSIPSILVLPNGFDMSSATIGAMSETDDGVKTFSIMGIKGSISNYNADITIKPIDNPTDVFTDFSTTARKETLMLNVNRRVLTDEDRENGVSELISYEQQALEIYKNKSVEFMNNKYKEACEKVKTANEKYGTDLPMPDESEFIPATEEEILQALETTYVVEYYKNIDVTHVVFGAEFRLDTSVGDIRNKFDLSEDLNITRESDNNMFPYEGEAKGTVKDVMFLFPTPRCKATYIKIHNGSRDMSSDEETYPSCVKANLYIINTLYTDEYNYAQKDPVQDLSSKNVHFEYTQRTAGDYTTLYTNVQNLHNEAVTPMIVHQIPRVYEDGKKRNRAYNINVHITETTSNTFAEGNKDINVLEYIKE